LVIRWILDVGVLEKAFKSKVVSCNKIVLELLILSVNLFLKLLGRVIN